jgi:hypothetical protein
MTQPILVTGGTGTGVDGAEVLGYSATRRAHAKAHFRVHPQAILADGQMERDGQLRTWQTVGVFRIADGRIAECWLVPMDQYLFDELWS